MAAKLQWIVLFVGVYLCGVCSQRGWKKPATKNLDASQTIVQSAGFWPKQNPPTYKILSVSDANANNPIRLVVGKYTSFFILKKKKQKFFFIATDQSGSKLYTFREYSVERFVQLDIQNAAESFCEFRDAVTLNWKSFEIFKSLKCENGFPAEATITMMGRISYQMVKYSILSPRLSVGIYSNNDGYFFVAFPATADKLGKNYKCYPVGEIKELSLNGAEDDFFMNVVKPVGFHWLLLETLLEDCQERMNTKYNTIQLAIHNNLMQFSPTLKDTLSNELITIRIYLDTIVLEKIHCMGQYVSGKSIVAFFFVKKQDHTIVHVGGLASPATAAKESEDYAVKNQQ